MLSVGKLSSEVLCMESTYSDRYANLTEDPAMEAYFSQLPGYIQDQIRARMEAEGADRWAIQNAIMPYQDLLPKRLRGRNERIGEPLTD